MAPAQPLIRLVDVAKSFGPLCVLDGVTLDLLRGQTTVVVGPSGTGKSVLLKHIVGLIRPDRGAVWFDDLCISRLGAADLVSARTRIGFLFQMGALFDSMSVGENIMFPLREHTRQSRLQRRERCREVLDLVGLAGLEPKMPSDLSGGQRKRVALARAIVLKPEVILYDEPTTGLDPIRADLINELIIALSRRLGVTSIVVTHDMASARKIAHRIVMLYDGRVVVDAEPDAFLKSEHELVRRFVEGRAEPSDLDSIRGVTEAGP